MLRADDLWFAYARAPVVCGASVALRAGEALGLLGPNGSGKTTLLRLLAGTLVPSGGRVTLDGRDLRTLGRGRLARRIAVVPQETHLAFDYSVLEIALMGRYPHLDTFAVEGPDDLRIARDALAATGTLHLAGRPFTTLSGGEKQRVIIASGLAQLDTAGEAGILLLDEPTASLDLGYQIEVGALIRRLHRERGVALVVSTHDLNFAAGICDRVALLRDGRVLAAGGTSDVLTRDVIRALYDVEAEVSRHAGTGRIVIVPLDKSALP